MHVQLDYDQVIGLAMPTGQINVFRENLLILVYIII